MTSHDITLRKVGEEPANSLPKNVCLVMIGDKPVFCHRHLGKLLPLPTADQILLSSKHIKHE